MYTVNAIRNICLLGHSGSGKSALAESLLYMTGAIDRMGKNADGNTVSDYDPEEIRRNISISTSVIPVEYHNTKINILDTPGGFDFSGAVMEALRASDAAILVLSAKDGITVVRIHSTRMLMAYGFLRKVFEVFEEFRTAIDMITTSEVAVSLTVDDDSRLEGIVERLREFGTIEIERGNTIVCVVGRCDQQRTGLAARIFEALHDVPIKMISYGASPRSVALLIDTRYKKQTLQTLNDRLF